MKKNTLFFALILLFVIGALTAVFLGGLQRNPRILPSVLEGKNLPTLDLPEYFTGKILSHADLPTQAFLLNVWGTWCPACYAEMPFLNQLNDQIPIVGLNWPANNPNERQNIQSFFQQFANPYIALVVDDTGRMITDLGVYGAPETFLISADRRILHRYAGELTPSIWQQEFLPLLKEKQP